MKKIAIVLLAFLIGVCCIGFVSCNVKQETPVKPSESQSIEESSSDRQSENDQSSAGQNGNQSSSQRKPVDPVTDGGAFDGGKYD